MTEEHALFGIVMLVVYGLIGLLLLAAQLKQFDIAKELKRIRELLENVQTPAPPVAHIPTSSAKKK